MSQSTGYIAEPKVEIQCQEISAAGRAQFGRISQIQDKQRQEEAATRKSLVGSGDRSEKIRTYNYPQGRVTDHRINLTLYKLDNVMQGDLGEVVEPLVKEYQADQLAQLAKNG